MRCNILTFFLNHAENEYGDKIKHTRTTKQVQHLNHFQIPSFRRYSTLKFVFKKIQNKYNSPSMLKMIKNYGLHKRKDEINEILILFFQKIFHFQFNYHCYK